MTLGKRVNEEVWEGAEELGPGSWWREWQDGGWEKWLRVQRGGGDEVESDSGEEEELRVRARRIMYSSDEGGAGEGED